jgi:hypothetical protein
MARQSPESFMEQLLLRFVDPGSADRCVTAMDGLDYDDVPGIESVLMQEPMAARHADEVLQRYKEWLLLRPSY